MNAYFHLSYAVASFIITLTSQIYLWGWLTNTIVPVTIDNKPSSWDTLVLLPDSPVINNILLIIVFALQHSMLARRTVKAIISTCLPDGFERIVYNVTTAITMYLMFLLWEPLPRIIWHITIPWLRYIVIVVRLGFILASMKSLGLFSLDGISGIYGIRQPASHLMKRESPKVSLITTGIFGITTSQLLFAITMTIYIVVSVLYLEERDLIHQFGSQYEEYKKTTPAFIPSLWRSHNSND
ncbi:methanethiol S-methyltransferase-like isoform X2 [Dysidea avara]|uniref:methanethiol S-methyltransferase-like isoform X2 n=1 Tax=Dysidea avara TaxID=196820 RepID=UPI0033165BBD